MCVSVNRDDAQLKADLISNFDKYLQKNQTRLQDDKALETYWQTRRKPRESLAGTVEKAVERITSDTETEVKSAVKKTVKKANKVKAEAEYVSQGVAHNDMMLTHARAEMLPPISLPLQARSFRMSLPGYHRHSHLQQARSKTLQQRAELLTCTLRSRRHQQSLQRRLNAPLISSTQVPETSIPSPVSRTLSTGCDQHAQVLLVYKVASCFSKHTPCKRTSFTGDTHSTSQAFHGSIQQTSRSGSQTCSFY